MIVEDESERPERGDIAGYEDRVHQFLRDFDVILETRFSDSDCIRIMKRLVRHHGEMWTFLTDNVPCHNNAAELELRRAVVNRKVSCGNRSDVGARVQEVIPSVIRTARLRGKHLMIFFLSLRWLHGIVLEVKGD